MIVHKCDICQREMGGWYDISISSMDPILRRYIRHAGFKLEVCKKCLLDNVSSAFIKEEYLEPSTRY